jgi:hypothetical protein
VPPRFPPRLAESPVKEKKWINSNQGEIRWLVMWGGSETEADDKDDGRERA